MTTPIFFSTPHWGVSGVNIFLANVVTGLNERGFNAHILTSGSPGLEQGMPRDDRLPVIEFKPRWYHNQIQAWQQIATFLCNQQPCIFVPGFDWFFTWMSASLPAEVDLVSILHSDEPIYYDMARRLHPFTTRTVTVSDAIAQQVLVEQPDAAARLSSIPYGVPCPDTVKPRLPVTDRPLRLIYPGRIVQYQKRIFDIPPIFDRLAARGVAATLTVVGSGSDEAAFRVAAQSHLDQGTITIRPPMRNTEVRQLLREHDGFLLPSEFEGLPIALLDAMSEGCVPVVSDIRSGVPQVIRDGENGFRVPIGGLDMFAHRIEQLANDLTLRHTMAHQAHHTVLHEGYTLDDMCDRYAALFEEVIALRASGHVLRQQETVRPWNVGHVAMQDYIPYGLRPAVKASVHLWRNWMPSAKKIERLMARRNSAANQALRSPTTSRQSDLDSRHHKAG